MFRSATLVLIEAMRASDMPHESLKHLFTPERCRIEFLRNDVKILIGAYLPLGEILRSKLKSIEHFIQLYKDTSVKQTAVSVPQYARDAYRSYVQAIQENPALANADFPEVHQWIKDHGVELDKRPYDLPDFKTWRRYRSEGERFAKPASE